MVAKSWNAGTITFANPHLGRPAVVAAEVSPRACGVGVCGGTPLFTCFQDLNLGPLAKPFLPWPPAPGWHKLTRQTSVQGRFWPQQAAAPPQQPPNGCARTSRVEVVTYGGPRISESMDLSAMSIEQSGRARGHNRVRVRRARPGATRLREPCSPLCALR